MGQKLIYTVFNDDDADDECSSVDAEGCHPETAGLLL